MTLIFTFVEWQALGHDTNSLCVDPWFVSTNSASINLHIIKESPCRAHGTASFNGINAPSTDIDGDSRPQGQGYDMGSDEVNVPSRTMIIFF